ncbi:transmembrane protein, putative [Medicago truncatula]|uniref:Transmembrane protein, putative n=1 Tax=Medicago truncatula TaxID=3880 RepID=G7K636_MEDTR|nr:transmembrane protein, putative [Medicago truncatula]
MPSTALSYDINFNDPPLPFIPPPPSPLVNGGVVVPQTPSLSKPPSPMVNSDPDSQNNKEEIFLRIFVIIFLVVLIVVLIASATVVYFLYYV